MQSTNLRIFSFYRKQARLLYCRYYLATDIQMCRLFCVLCRLDAIHTNTDETLRGQCRPNSRHTKTA